MNIDPDQRRDHIAAVALMAVVGLASLGTLLDLTGHPLTIGLVAAGLALLTGVVRWVARILRERREDAADTLAGAAWRAHHMPSHMPHQDRPEAA